jgi:hypothetical protein
MYGPLWTVGIHVGLRLATLARVAADGDVARIGTVNARRASRARNDGAGGLFPACVAIVDTSIRYGSMNGMSSVRKITVIVDSALLSEAQNASGLGVTEVVREGLKAVAASRATQAIRKWRGKAALQLDIDALRADR